MYGINIYRETAAGVLFASYFLNSGHIVPVIPSLGAYHSMISFGVIYLIANEVYCISKFFCYALMFPFIENRIYKDIFGGTPILLEAVPSLKEVERVKLLMDKKESDEIERLFSFVRFFANSLCYEVIRNLLKTLIASALIGIGLEKLELHVQNLYARVFIEVFCVYGAFSLGLGKKIALRADAAEMAFDKRLEVVYKDAQKEKVSTEVVLDEMAKAFAQELFR